MVISHSPVVVVGDGYVLMLGVYLIVGGCTLEMSKTRIAGWIENGGGHFVIVG